RAHPRERTTPRLAAGELAREARRLDLTKGSARVLRTRADAPATMRFDAPRLSRAASPRAFVRATALAIFPKFCSYRIISKICLFDMSMKSFANSGSLPFLYCSPQRTRYTRGRPEAEEP